MRTTLYTQVLQRAAELAGRAYADDSGAVVLSGSDAIMFRTMIGQAVRRAWTYDVWPETTIHTLRRWAPDWGVSPTSPPPAPLSGYTRGNIVWWPVTEEYYLCIAQSTTSTPTRSLIVGGEQTLRAGVWFLMDDEYSADDWLSNVQYTVGDLVRVAYLDQYYALAVSAAPGVSPLNDAYWSPVTPIVRRVDLEQEWEGQALGDPFGVYLEDPLTTEEPKEATYTWDEEGLRILDKANGVYLHAWTPEPSFFTDPATVPTRFSQYAALAAAGFMLRSEGKTDQGNELVKMAEAVIADESSKITRRETRSGRIHLQRR